MHDIHERKREREREKERERERERERGRERGREKEWGGGGVELLGSLQYMQEKLRDCWSQCKIKMKNFVRYYKMYMRR